MDSNHNFEYEYERDIAKLFTLHKLHKHYINYLLLLKYQQY